MKSFTYESKFYRLKYKDKILFGTYIGGSVTLDLAKEIVKKRLELMNYEDVLILVDIEKPRGIDRAAREYLSSEKGMQGVKAGAIVTSSAFTKHLANFFIKISFTKSKIPAKVFSNEKEAIIWLRKFE